MAAALDRAGDTDVPPTLWFDVEDLFEHIAVSARTTGIQRATFEIYRALLDDAAVAGRIRFVRHDRLRRMLRRVAWPNVARLFAQLSGSPGDPSHPHPAPPVRTDVRLRRLADRLPPGL